jgi:hypothetical protein
MASTAAPPRAGEVRALRPDRLLALCGLTGFAVSQPLLSIAGGNPTLFTFAGVDRAGLVVFAVMVALVPPLALWAVVVGVGLVDRRAGDLTYTVVAATLVAATATQLAKGFGVTAPAALAALAVVIAGAFVMAMLRWRWVDLWVRYTSPLPVLAVVVFLAASPSGQLLRPPATVEQTDASRLAPVVFVMLDELPLRSVLDANSAIDAVRFPNLAALADDATWHRNFTVMAPQTTQSVPSLLTGRNPTDDPPLWSSHPDSLFSLLASTHDLEVSESLTQLCGFEACGTPEGAGERTGLTGVLVDIVEVWNQRVWLGPADDPDLEQFQEVLFAVDEDRPAATADEVLARPDRLTTFLEALMPGARPGLHYLHLIFPHQPWSSYPDGTQYQAPEPDIDMSDRSVTGAAGGWPMAILEQQHLLQAQYTDRLVGEVLDRLADTGLYDDALVVVTADHGLTFKSWPDQRTPADPAAVGDVAHVPLLVKAPGQTRGRVDDTNLMAVDLLPTLAELLGVEVAWEVDGHPAGSPPTESRRGKAMFDFGTDYDGTFQGIDPLVSPRPAADARLIGPLAADANPVTALVDLLGLGALVDRSIDDLDLAADPIGSATVSGLADLVNPPPEDAIPAFIEGTAEGFGDGDAVLVVIDDTIVSAAPVDQDGGFRTLLPPVLEPDNNDVRLAVLTRDGTVGEVQVS